MKKWLFCAVLSYGALHAALPPFYQSLREMEAVLTDPRLHELLGSAEMIQQVSKTDEGYLVLTQNYLVRVDLRYLPAKMLGPAHFELEFNNPVPAALSR
jgi:hypothetical protein